MIWLLRLGLMALGAVMFVVLTGDVMDGEVTFSRGWPYDDTVPTQSVAEAVATWLAFTPIFVGLVLLGLRPRLYVERQWLWKVLLAITVTGYIGGGFLRW